MAIESGIDTLIRFARLASEARKGGAILPMMADALVADVGAAAVAVLEIEAQGSVRLVPSPHVPEELLGMELDAEMMDTQLGRVLGARCAHRFPVVQVRPMVCAGGLFGAVAMFFEQECAAERLRLAEGLLDLAAIALESVAKLHALVDSHAQLRASQQRLVRSERLRALGEMAAGVSHDLKNILNPLQLQLQLVQRRVDQGKTEDARRTLSEMKQVLARGGQTLDRLRDYGRQSREPRADEPLDLAQLALEAREIARPRMVSRSVLIEFVTDELAPAPVRGQGGDIVSALVNLLVNAIDATQQSGTITLRSGQSEEGSWIEVADNGPGMPPEVEQRVFEPFFTTKGTEGTGLGLAMVYACMQRHGGYVRLRTAPGQGTSFRLEFPPNAGSTPPLG